MEGKKMKTTIQIPSDIIFDIFSWLPVNSLFRFKCVSRFCNSLVSYDESFVDVHQSRSLYGPDKTKFLAYSRKKKLYTIDLKVKHRKASALRIEELDGIIFDRFEYVKGLFCLWHTLRVQPQSIIYNPTTRKVRYLPCLKLVDKQTSWNYFIGFEPDKKKYKILMITQSDKNSRRYWVFTLGSSESWREIKSATHDSLLTLFLNGKVCVDGVIYILGSYNYKLCIVAFNVRTENFKIISIWEDVRRTAKVRIGNLIELEGKCAVIDHSRWYKGEMDLWILETSEEWVKHTIVAFPSDLFSRLGIFNFMPFYYYSSW